jgi:hypothetical protein
MVVNLVFENAEHAGHEACRAVWVMAGTSATYKFHPSRYVVSRVAVLDTSELFESAGDCIQAVNARAALPRAFVGEVARDTRRLEDAANRSRKHDE